MLIRTLQPEVNPMLALFRKGHAQKQQTLNH
ncbi:Uncharacterised protein [Vibrio cholerae]|nr:Uncharacterised protein [Vibrio cholerae]